jgi:hypothetical protein
VPAKGQLRRIQDSAGSHGNKLFDMCRRQSIGDLCNGFLVRSSFDNNHVRGVLIKASGLDPVYNSDVDHEKRCIR